MAQFELSSSSLVPAGLRRMTTTGMRNTRRSSTRVGAFLTDVDLGGPAAPEKGVYKVEDAVLPNMDSDSPSSLPEAANIDRVLDNVMSTLEFSNQHTLQTWKAEFFSEASTGVICDSFWWIVSNFFQQSKDLETENKLFTRVAQNYVAIFLHVHPARKDSFFARYPDAVAQSIFYSLYLAFPKSRSKFTAPFRTDLLVMLSEWMSGLRPAQPSTRHWKLDLGAGNVLRQTGSQTGSTLRSSASLPGPSTPSRELRSTLPTLSASVNLQMSVGRRGKREPQVFQYSILVKHFLEQKRHKGQSVRPLRLLLTKVTEAEKAVDAKYEKFTEIATESAEKCQEMMRNYDEMTEDLKREMRNLREETNKHIRLLEKRKEQVLHTDVHEYSNYLVSMWTMQDEAQGHIAMGEV
eukprot:GILK01001837.1.p1 GENE.GILK01001837.1~~GILK01001837.1.p1  ORF type:complete len:407 (-),score=59.98 GILK01001837.1:124-1344(-)